VESLPRDGDVSIRCLQLCSVALEVPAGDSHSLASRSRGFTKVRSQLSIGIHRDLRFGVLRKGPVTPPFLPLRGVGIRLAPLSLDSCSCASTGMRASVGPLAA
jgi:hypothetical protein